MFEQSLYETHEPVVSPQEGGMFHNYELRSWDWSPRFFKIAGAVAVVNILLLVGVAQTSLLTTKGCDSPLVGRVCQVLDTVYVGAVLFGTEREMVDAEYDRTELADADITFVNVGGDNAPLYYPSDYLKYSDPERYAAEQAALLNPTDPNNGMLAPGIPASTAFPSAAPADPLTNTKPRYAKPKANVVAGNLPSGINDTGTDVDDNAPLNGGRGKKTAPLGDGTTAPAKPCDDKGQIPGIPGSKCKSDTPDAGTTAKADEAAPDQFGIYINKRPTRVFANEVLQRLEAKQITLDQPFRVTIKGTLGKAKDGKTIVLKNPKPVLGPNETAGDPKMLELASQAIIAFADAGWFGYLDKLKSKNVTIYLEQNDQVVTARLTADQPDENEAKTRSSELNLLLYGAAVAANGDTKTFLEAAKTGYEGKTFFVNFALPRQAFTELVQRKLAEQKATPTPTPGQPEGGNSTVKVVNNAGSK